MESSSTYTWMLFPSLAIASGSKSNPRREQHCMKHGGGGGGGGGLALSTGSASQTIYYFRSYFDQVLLKDAARYQA